jgi:hypothetical protein
MSHDPADFGLSTVVPAPMSSMRGRCVGPTEALLTDPIEHDEGCVRHDAEMDGIRNALLAKFGKVPLLETYRQMAIRQQKAKEWSEVPWWAERGLALYAQSAAHPEAVNDLKNVWLRTERSCLRGHAATTGHSDNEGNHRRASYRNPGLRQLRQTVRSTDRTRSQAATLPVLPIAVPTFVLRRSRTNNGPR